MRVAAVIPARFGSERLPGKPLADIAGKPMIVRVIERVALARGVERTVVATDDERIVAAVKMAGGEALMTPADCLSGSDCCARAALLLGPVDVVVNVQGDEPLISPGAVEELLTAFADPTVQMATLARPLKNGEYASPSVVKVVRDFAGTLSTSRARPSRSLAAGASPGAYAPMWASTVFARSFLQTFARLPPTPLEQVEKLEQLRALEHGVKIRVLDTSYASLGVDTPEDLERVRALLTRQAAESAREAR